ncbi:SymE family type I addiction module toxin, partial [Xanthomonas perforans]
HYPGAHDHAGDQHVPHVRLSGLWLEQLGFAIGTKLRITASAGRVRVRVGRALADAVGGRRRVMAPPGDSG